METSFSELINRNKKNLEEMDEFHNLLTDENNKLRSLLFELLDCSKNGDTQEINKLISCLFNNIKEIDIKTSKSRFQRNTSSNGSIPELLGSIENNFIGLKIKHCLEESCSSLKLNKVYSNSNVEDQGVCIAFIKRNQ